MNKENGYSLVETNVDVRLFVSGVKKNSYKDVTLEDGVMYLVVDDETIKIAELMESEIEMLENKNYVLDLYLLDDKLDKLIEMKQNIKLA